MTTSPAAASAEIEVSAATFDTTVLKASLGRGHLLWPVHTALTEEQVDDRVARCQQSLVRFRAGGKQGNFLPDNLPRRRRACDALKKRAMKAWIEQQASPSRVTDFSGRS